MFEECFGVSGSESSLLILCTVTPAGSMNKYVYMVLTFIDFKNIYLSFTIEVLPNFL